MQVDVLVSNVQFLDNVMPVILKLKRAEKTSRVRLIFFTEHLIVTAGPTHPLVCIAQELVDEILFPQGDDWVLWEPVLARQSITQISQRSTRLSRALSLRRMPTLISRLKKVLSLNPVSEVLICDYTRLKGGAYEEMLTAIRCKKIVGLRHGDHSAWGVEEIFSDELHKRKENVVRLSRIHPSAEKRIFDDDPALADFANFQGLIESNAPPRLDSDWVRFVLDQDETHELQNFKLSKGFGLLVSRYVLSSGIPVETFNQRQKNSALKNVRRTLESFSLVPVLQKHPSERVPKNDLRGFTRFVTTHYLPLIENSEVNLSFGTSLLADCGRRGTGMIIYRPDLFGLDIEHRTNIPYSVATSLKELTAQVEQRLNEKSSGVNHETIHSTDPILQFILS